MGVGFAPPTARVSRTRGQSSEARSLLRQDVVASFPPPPGTLHTMSPSRLLTLPEPWTLSMYAPERIAQT